VRAATPAAATVVRGSRHGPARPSEAAPPPRRPGIDTSLAILRPVISRWPWRLRAAALVAGAALALHQLRYLIGYAGHSESALAHHGHAYLTALTPIVMALIALAGAHFVVLLTRARRLGAVEGAPPPLRMLSLGASAVLLAIYASQELTEGLLESGHPGGAAALLAHGGLVAVPLALGLGTVVALLLRGARSAIAVAARRGRRSLPRPAVRATHPRRRPTRPQISVLARHLAGRSPPLPC
jgi:hypothetical protein